MILLSTFQISQIRRIDIQICLLIVKLVSRSHIENIIQNHAPYANNAMIREGGRISFWAYANWIAYFETPIKYLAVEYNIQLNIAARKVVNIQGHIPL